MNKYNEIIVALLFVVVISFGLCSCGTGNENVAVGNGTNPSQSGTVFVNTGTILSDSWGYTGANPFQVAVPSQTAIVVEGHTLLVDASQTIVSGTTNTKISYSSDKSTLTAAAQASAPANFISYVNIFMGSVTSTIPALSVTVDVGTVPSGTLLTVLNYDVSTGMWTSAQTATVSSSGKITFPVNQLSLWGIFQ